MNCSIFAAGIGAVESGPTRESGVVSHEEIERLERRVRHLLSGRLRVFRLLVLDNGLILKGQARTYYTKQLAQHAVMEATRLPILANDIEVT
jgi:hypothetical protein